MNEHILDHEGPIFSFLDKVGRMIMLSVLWLIGCLPIVTAVSATTALYYTVVKNVRREHGSAVKEFWRSYRGNLKRGIPASFVILLVGYLLAVNIPYLTSTEYHGSNLLLWGSMIIGLLFAGVCVYLCPVLSRFSMNLVSALKLSFVMAIRFFPLTALIAAGAAVTVYLQIYILPIPAILILPSFLMWLVSFPMEKVLRKYMPPKDEHDDAWYYQ